MAVGFAVIVIVILGVSVRVDMVVRVAMVRRLVADRFMVMRVRMSVVVAMRVLGFRSVGVHVSTALSMPVVVVVVVVVRVPMVVVVPVVVRVPMTVRVIMTVRVLLRVTVLLRVIMVMIVSRRMRVAMSVRMPAVEPMQDLVEVADRHLIGRGQGSRRGADPHGRGFDVGRRDAIADQRHPLDRIGVQDPAGEGQLRGHGRELREVGVEGACAGSKAPRARRQGPATGRRPRQVGRVGAF